MSHPEVTGMATTHIQGAGHWGYTRVMPRDLRQRFGNACATVSQGIGTRRGEMAGGAHDGNGG
jgi:hypothetical protein